VRQLKSARRRQLCDTARLSGGETLPHSRSRDFSQGTKVMMRGFFENALFGAVVAYVLARPRRAPGPTEQQVAEQQLASAEVAAAQEKLGAATAAEKAEANVRLEEALERLAQAEQELKAAEEDLRRYPVPRFLEATSDAGKVMIAVTGASGSGKSSWINAIRKLRPMDTDAAKVGVNETTMEPTKYIFPPLGASTFGKLVRGASKLFRGQKDEDPIQVGDRLLLLESEKKEKYQAVTVKSRKGPEEILVSFPDGEEKLVPRNRLTAMLSECILWDLPGIGTERFPQDVYLRDMGIRHFDMVVLLSASRFTEAEIKLVEEMRYWAVPHFLVRNKVDLDVQAEIDREEEDSGKPLSSREKERVAKQTIQRIKDYFRNELGADVYCLSTRPRRPTEDEEADLLDMRQLEMDMQRALESQRFEV